MSPASAPNLAPEGRDKPSLPSHELPLLRATAENLQGFGALISDPDGCEIEIVRWPAQGWRAVDPGTGDQGGTTEGIFEFRWDGPTLRAHNTSVGGQNQYVLGWSCDPQAVDTQTAAAPTRERVLLWHANYHPDGGQLFYPRAPGAFVAPLALPGDDVTPDDFLAFWFDGSRGLYIHPGVWHEAVFPVTDRQPFFDKQGKVHARVSVDFGAEFGCYLSAPLPQRL
ncbi:MAG: ureidoglycolate lyase [Gammaproteobacteria bacterium]|nr:ureidoglycolate lyase [Gammaproteobacteria bacterium]